MDDGEDAGERWVAGDLDGPARHNGYHAEPDEPPRDDERAGGWVSAGGVLRWEPGEADAPAGDQAHSPLAAERFEMPEGAPDATRVAAVRAWLVRKREGTEDELGALLLRQREQRHEEPPAGRRPRRGPVPPTSVDQELAEQQAASNTYAALVDALDEHVAHGGPARALVEYHLWLADQLEELAAAARELLAAAAPDPLAVAAWNGQAQAVVATRGRVERMMAPVEDD